MIQFGRSGARLALVLLCVLAAALEAQTSKSAAQQSAAPQFVPGASASLPMPNVLWLERNDALALVRRQLHRLARIDGEAGIVIAQDPRPDAKVSGDVTIVLTLGLPKLSISASDPNPRTDEKVTFSVSVDPLPANGAQVGYHFVWDDGSEVFSQEPQTTRAFSEARVHTVMAYAVINDRWKTDRTAMRVSVVPPLPPPPDPLVIVPQLLWLERYQVDELLKPLQLRASIAGQDGIVLDQSIAAGSEVAPGSDITVTLGLPRLTLSTPAVNPRANEDVPFNLTFDPPPPFAPQVTYRIAWRDGTEQAPTDQANVTHRFAAAGNYLVSATALIGNRQVESNNLGVAVADPGATPTPTSTMPPPLPVDSAPATVPVSEPPPPTPPSIPWLAILIAVVVLTAAALLVRALRAKPASPQSPPPVSIRSGLGSTNHTIENPDRIRSGLSVRLRTGMRSAAAIEGGADA